MNKKTYIILLLTTGLFLHACKKNTDIFVPDPGQLNGPDTNWYSIITPAMPVSQLKTGLSFPTYTDSILVNGSNAYVTTPFGLVCGFPPNSCVGSTGLPVTGTVNVDLVLIRSKGDMIRLGTPSTSGSRLLVSGGELFVGLKKDGQALQLAPGAKINLRYNDVPISTQMRFFTGDLSNPDRFNWVPNTNSQNNSISFTSQTYEIQTNQLSWVGCHYFYDTTGINQVTVTANLASNFTNANTVAYMVFKDFRSVAGMYGETSTRKFSTGMLPVGKAVTLVVISKQGNDYFMGYQNTVTTAPTPGATTQSVTITPVIRSLPDIISFLSTL